MIKVSLIAQTNELPTNLISHAAKTCYTSIVPEMGKTIDVESNLFKTGHHTTLQHNYFSFTIEGLSVSSTIFGLHLSSPFYNTDQRSGRFSKMYTKPDYDELKTYILKYWPEADIEKIIEFIKKGRLLYKNNIEKATEVAKKLIKQERPFADEEYIETQAPKIAQEQMRVFISTIFPTALDHTINLSALTAIYRSAWSPELRDITNQMKELVIAKYPDLSYMFDEKTRRTTDWAPKIDLSNIKIEKEPNVFDFEIKFEKNIDLNENKKDSVDLNYFTPEKMENNMSTIKYTAEISLATMGQDQRHRTIKRGIPECCGHFYLPPILNELELEKAAFDYLYEYKKLTENINSNLALSIAPYGLMFKYGKVGDLNAIIHEQEKRLCWSAQEEIYNLSRKFHEKMINNTENEKLNDDCKKLAALMVPACYKKTCIEGRRYCGRDVSKLKNDKSIPIRKC